MYLGAAAGEVATLIAALGAAGALGVRLEQSKLGWPVTRWIQALECGDEVGRLTGEGTCMMMTHADAGTLERGYADLEPELAWQQWQILRESRS